MDFPQCDITLCLVDWFHLIVSQPTHYSTQVYLCIENHEWSCCLHAFPKELLKQLCCLKLSISWCYWFRHPMDEWIGRNILKIEIELEYNNPKHLAAKHVLPFQGWEFNTWSELLVFVLPLQVGFFSAKGLNYIQLRVRNQMLPAHSNFFVFCNGDESSFMACARS